MVPATAIYPPFHLQRLPLNAAMNVSTEYIHGQHSPYQQHLMSLSAEAKLPETYDDKDVTIAILEGQGSLTLTEEIIPLEPGRFVFIPAHMPHQLNTETRLVFLLSRCDSDPGIHDSAWMINL
jgi:mannose-6-phosphate isomerase-like protein (cupin superfamily)